MIARRNVKVCKSCVAGKWCSDLIEFNENSDMQINENYEGTQPLRDNGAFLMAEFVQSGFKQGDLKKLNYAQKHLQVFSLAGITASSGLHITEATCNGARGNGLQREVSWPRVPHQLPMSFIKLWQTALSETFSQCLAIAEERGPDRPLGEWMGEQSWKHWRCWCNKRRKRLLEQLHGRHSAWCPQNTRNRNHFSKSEETIFEEELCEGLREEEVEMRTVEQNHQGARKLKST